MKKLKKMKVPGSCGELVQGIYHGEPILITCPIRKFTTVEVLPKYLSSFALDGFGEKSLQMLKKVLDYLRIDEGFTPRIRLKSELPVGKGMASSSADMAAVASTVGWYFGEYIPPEKIAEFATEIEPTDGIFYSGIVAMNPFTGKLIEKFLFFHGYKIAIFDYGGEVDTLKFNRRSNFVIEEPLRLNFDLIEESALANQEILYKPHLEDIMDFAKDLGALGVNVAHSGTVIGIFFRDNDSRIDKKIDKIQARFDFIKFLTKTSLYHGGCYWYPYNFLS